MRFAALDFETANHRADSPCQLAIVIVDEGKIVSEHCWLIRPKRLYFSPQCVAVHGILPEQVQDQPEWSELWSEIFGCLDGQLLLAHNAGFDMRVMNQTLLTYDIACSELEYSCTRLIARRCWPGRGGYGLKVLADGFGMTFRHHDALEDARVCAKIALKAAEQLEVDTMEKLEEALGIRRGRMRYGTLVSPKCVRRTRIQLESDTPMSPDQPRSMGERSGNRYFRRDGFPESQRLAKQRRQVADGLVGAAEGQLPLAGKVVVLNGSLLGLERVDAVQFLERLGAKVQNQITLQTQYVIIGHVEDVDYKKGGFIPMQIASREQEVEVRQSEGQPIRVLSQRQLLALIPGGLEAARAIAGG